MAAEFRRIYGIQGFDRDQAPRWQMVPTGGDRYVILRDAAGLTVSSADATVATVSEIKREDLPAAEAFARRFKLRYSFALSPGRRYAHHELVEARGSIDKALARR